MTIKRFIHKQVIVCLQKSAPAQRTMKLYWYGSGDGGIKRKNEMLFYI